MTWQIISTDHFIKFLKKHKKNPVLIQELDKKIHRLKDDPIVVGKFLRGKLAGQKSTRLTSKYRLIFSIDQKNNRIYLKALDHRGKVYD